MNQEQSNWEWIDKRVKKLEEKKQFKMNLYELDSLTTYAQYEAKKSGSSLNFELLKLINAWIGEKNE